MGFDNSTNIRHHLQLLKQNSFQLQYVLPAYPGCHFIHLYVNKIFRIFIFIYKKIFDPKRNQTGTVRRRLLMFA